MEGFKFKTEVVPQDEAESFIDKQSKGGWAVHNYAVDAALSIRVITFFQPLKAAKEKDPK